MDNAYNMNGLLAWSESELELRDHLIRALPIHVRESLEAENRGWIFRRIETPVIIPSELVHHAYSEADVYHLENFPREDHIPRLTLRPETTAGTFEVMRKLIENQQLIPPCCFWQVGKSFRREQDQPTKFMRLKEFNQLEFQCLYAGDSKNDYQSAMIGPLTTAIWGITGKPTRSIDSDRLPSYSQRTIDLEVWDQDSGRWMEVCSISVRTDFPIPLRFTTNKGLVEKSALVLEIAFGIDRLVYLRSLIDSAMREHLSLM